MQSREKVMRAGGRALTVASFIGLLVGAVWAERSQESSSAEGGKRALIVAIGAYASPDWDTLSSANDVPLMRAGLELHGFPPESIHVLADSDATKKGIQEAIETHLASADEGDVVFLHYSGHGQRIPDDDGDELDGYDETWVPHDAPRSGDGYSGDRHLRDDELSAILTRLRRAVGPSGNVVLSIDSCYSGGTSRGTARVRGGPPMGEPARRTRSATSDRGDAGGGFFEEAPRTRSIADASTELAPYVVFSAARHDQLDYETVDDDGRVVGPLTLAISKTLAGTEPVGTYRELFERVEWVMQSRVPNRPQVEGSIDSELFSGRAVTQRPFVDVASVRSGGKQVVLSAGSLQGLLEGSRVELHRAGTRTPTPETLLSAAVVSEITYLEAVAELEASARRSELEQARAFVTEYTFGDLRVKVGLELADGAFGGSVKEALETLSAVELVASDPDLTIRDADGGLVVSQAATGDVLLGPIPADSSSLDVLRARMLDFARSRYLRGLGLRDDAFDVALELVPLDATRCRDERDPGTCEELDVSAKQADGAEQVWKIGDYFKLRARNESKRDAYITILDLPSDGTVNALWPPGDFSERKQLESGESWSPDVVYQFAEPPGNDVILLIATEDWIDFRPFLTGAGSQRSAPGPLGPFSPLFDDTSVRTRSAVTYEPGSVTTDSVTITVER